MKRRPPGKRQLAMLQLLWDQNAAQRVAPKGPKWARAGWVRINRRWVMLDALAARYMVQVRYRKGYKDGTAGWQARVMVAGRKALQAAGLIP